MTSSSLFSFHFLPAFLSRTDSCRYNGWYVICVHASWIKFLMAPRAVVLAVKKTLLQQCETGLLQIHFCSSLKGLLNTCTTALYATFWHWCRKLEMSLFELGIGEAEVASDKWCDKRAISIQGLMLWSGRSLKTWCELCALIVTQHYAHCLRLNNPVCGS